MSAVAAQPAILTADGNNKKAELRDAAASIPAESALLHRSTPPEIRHRVGGRGGGNCVRSERQSRFRCD